MTASAVDVPRQAAGSCQRCGQVYVVEIPPAGTWAMGAIVSRFRYCAACHRYVGRSCCWEPEAVACVDCASKPVPVGESDGPDAAVARAAADQIPGMLDQLEEIVRRVAAMPSDGGAVEALEDAWLEAGSLLVGVDSCRDRTAKRLRYGAWSSPTILMQLSTELDAHLARRAAAVAELRSAFGATSGGLVGISVGGPHPARPTPPPSPATSSAAAEPAPPAAARSAPPPMPRALGPAAAGPAPPLPVPEAADDRSPGRRRARLLGVAALAGVLVIASVAGAMAIDRAGRGTPIAVLPGGSAGPVTSSSADITASAPAISRSTLVDFDQLRMGPGMSSGALVVLAGEPQVAAFPTAVDRSLELIGPQPATVCVDPGGTVGLGARLSFTVFLRQPASAGLMDVAIGEPDGPVAAQIPALSLQRLAAAKWHTITLGWTEDGVELAIDGAEPDLLEPQPPDGVPASSSAPGMACLHVAGQPAGENASLLVDTLRLDS